MNGRIATTLLTDRDDTKATVTPDQTNLQQNEPKAAFPKKRNLRADIKEEEEDTQKVEEKQWLEPPKLRGMIGDEINSNSNSNQKKKRKRRRRIRNNSDKAEMESEKDDTTTPLTDIEDCINIGMNELLNTVTINKQMNKQTNLKKKKKIIYTYTYIDCDFVPLTQTIIDSVKAKAKEQHIPPKWDEMYEGIYRMRSEVNGIAYNADVDRVGCAYLADQSADKKTQRFHLLVALLLSSQTRDPVTAQAMAKLKTKFNGLTVEAICSVKDIKQIDECICKVGFHNR
ncbi:hypothetical protein RFI_27100, partial [Reticulomyxa filosa]